MQILNFGSANIDFVYSLDAIVRPGETVQSKEIHIFPGGKGLNQAVAIARGKAPCFFAGTIGEDGQFLRELLENAGVNTGLLKISPNKNGHAIIQVDKSGHNSIIIANGANFENDRDYIDRVLSHFCKGDYLVLQNEINNLPYLIERAHDKGMVIFLNPSPINETVLSLNMNCLSYLVLNETEAEQIAGTEDTAEFLQKMRRAYPKLRVILTLGEDGSVYADENEQYRCAAYRVRAVDTTAAGDTFTGYLVATLSAGYPVKEAMKFASAAAAIAVSRPGAAVSIPQFDEVEKAIGTMPRNDKAEGEIHRQLRAYLQGHLLNASLGEFAESVGYCTDHVGRLVQKLTGKSFLTLLQELRCAEAARMLMETDATVEQIASSVGYVNESYFRKIFRRQYGTSPLSYRRDSRKNKQDPI